MAYDYDPLNMSDPNHPFARLGAELAMVQQQGMRRRSLADQLGGYPQQQRMPQQSTRLASMLGQPMQQAQQMPMGQMPQALAALFGQQQKFGSGASVSGPVPLGDPNKPGAAAAPGWFGNMWDGLFGGGAKAPG